MKLLLTSNGLKGVIAQKVIPLLAKSPQESKVAFITTAAYGEEGDTSWLENYREELRQLGITNIEDVDLRDATQEKLEEILADKNIVYVNGGNTFFLMHYVKQSGFGEAMKSFFEKDGLYIGVSAGSIIPNPTIEVAGYALSDEYPADANNVGLTDLTGLNWTSFLISPHYEDSQKELVESQAKNAKSPVVALTDEQAILVNGKTIKLVGIGEKVLLNNIPEESITI